MRGASRKLERTGALRKLLIKHICNRAGSMEKGSLTPLVAALVFEGLASGFESNTFPVNLALGR